MAKKAAKAGIEQAADHLDRLTKKTDKNDNINTVSPRCYEDSWHGNEDAAVLCVKENDNKQGCLRAKDYFSKALIKQIGYYAEIGQLGSMLDNIWNNKKQRKCRCILTFLEYLGGDYIDKLPTSCIDFLRNNAGSEKSDFTRDVDEYSYTMAEIIGLFDLMYWSNEEKKEALNKEYKGKWIIGAKETYRVLERKIWNYFLHSKEECDTINWKKKLQDIKEMYIIQKENPA